MIPPLNRPPNSKRGESKYCFSCYYEISNGDSSPQYLNLFVVSNQIESASIVTEFDFERLIFEYSEK